MSTLTATLATENSPGPSPHEPDPRPADPTPGEPLTPGDPAAPDPAEGPREPTATPAMQDPSLPDSRFFSRSHFASVVALLRGGSGGAEAAMS